MSYINEIIRVTYKCNWKCKFCNVIKVNNFGEKDISEQDIIFQILSLGKKYNKNELNNLILSFSGGEPFLNQKLLNYIKLAKEIGVGLIQIQTNGFFIYNNPSVLKEYIDSGLNELFIAIHSFDSNINSDMGCFLDDNKIKEFVYFFENNYKNKLSIALNIVINKINIFNVSDFLSELNSIGFLNILKEKKISLGIVQPNGYAWENRKEVLLNFNKKETDEIKNMVDYLEINQIIPDFHLTCPPLCILDYPKYNLEYNILNKINVDKTKNTLNNSNYELFNVLKNEKIKLEFCGKCKHNDNCLGFYKNWVSFVGKEYIINNFSFK